MPNTPPKEHLFLCHGKDCKKKQSSAHRALSTQCRAALEVGSVGCQGSCTGPTAVVMTGEGPVWFEDLRSDKARNDLVDYAVRVSLGKNATPSKRLAKRELTGKRKNAAARKFAKRAS